MQWNLFILLVSAAIVTLFIAAFVSYETQTIPSEGKISDKELIDRTMELAEVKAILTIHNEPQIYVNRIEILSVEYHVSTTQFEGKPYDPDNDCLFIKVRLANDGYPDHLVESNGKYRNELGDQDYIDFLEEGADCAPAMVAAIPDSVLLDKSREFEEVRAFFAKYPTAKYFIERGGGVEIVYEIRRSDISDEPWDRIERPQASAQLSLQLDSHLSLYQLYFVCSIGSGPNMGSFEIRDNIVQYLQQEEDCWNDDSLRAEANP